ncbi:MAG TPA: LysR family transcriptional regulator [Stellaceae bacterium]|jgi:DNA-binding transcriptional LysR family regulator|nr:LysR family transcriptional regulator [Stellaceae bacterium]
MVGKQLRVVPISDRPIAVQLWGNTIQWTDGVERRIKLRDLHILLAVVESGSMGRAAKRLAISQPVVSKTIADLELALGVRLLDRTAKGVDATVYGRALLNCGTAVFDDLRQGMQEIAFLSDPTVGELRIGGAGPFIDGLIPAVIARLADLYPRIEFHVTEADPPTLCSMLRERRLDLAILRTSSAIYIEDLESEALFDEPLLVIAGPNNPLSRRRKIDLKDLLGEPWALPELDNVASALIADGFRSAGLTLPTAQVVSDSMAVRTRLVEMGRFLTFLPGSALHFGAGWLRVKILPVKLSMKAPPTEIITLKNRTPNAIARLFIAELHTFAKPLKDARQKMRDASCPNRQTTSSAP